MVSETNLNGKSTPWLVPSEALNRQFNREAGEATQILDQEKLIRRLGFYIGNIGLLIGENVVSELTEMSSICPIPNTASWLVGLINLRGNLIPVFDLYTLLGIERDVSARKRTILLIMGQGDAAGALVLENLPVHIIFTESDKLESLPLLPDVLKTFTTSGFEKNGEIWFNFDHAGFFQSLTTRIAT